MKYLMLGPAHPYLATFIRESPPRFIYKVKGGPGEFMEGHDKNACLLGGQK